MEAKTTEQRVVDFVRDAGAAGLLAEIEKRAAGRHDARRSELAAELLTICATRASLLEVPSERVLARRIAFDAAAQAYRREAALLNQLELELLGCEATIDGREAHTRAEMREIAPQVLEQTDFKLSRLCNLVDAKTISKTVREQTFNGYRLVDVSNALEVGEVQKFIRAVADEVGELTYMALDAQSIRVECERLLSAARTKAATLVDANALEEILGKEKTP